MATAPQYPQAQHGGGPPNGTYGNPYAQQGHPSPYSPSGYGAPSPQSSFNTPQPYQQPQMQWSAQQPNVATPSRPPPASSPPSSSQMMPPPPKPNKEEREEKVGLDDINDSLFGSGINLKDEENYFHSIWNNRSAQESFATNKSTSFGSSTISPERSFNLLTQGSSFGEHANGAFAGTLGQSLTQEDIENEQKRKREQAARARAEREQHHLKNPFLLGNCLRKKLHQRAYESGVKLDVQGVYERAEPPRPQVMVNGAGNTGVAAVKDAAPSKVDVGVPFEQILSLLSLASGERLRVLVDDAYGLARARRYGDHGRVVPPEFADIARGESKQGSEKVEIQNISGSPWEQSLENEAVNGEIQAGGEKAVQSTSTISFQGTINAHLRKLTERDWLAEKERIKKREARKRKAENAGAGDEAVTTATDTPGDSPAPEAPAPKMTKKEMNKKNKENANATEAQAINSANTTAAMAFMGKKKNKYGWMTGGMGSVQGNRYAKPAPASPAARQESTASAAGSGGMDGAGSASANAEKKAPSWGDWREDAVNGKGIQLRDWVHVLERDGREKKALLRAGLKLR